MKENSKTKPPKLHFYNIFSQFGNVQSEPLYCSYFGEIPNVKTIRNIDCGKATLYVEGVLRDQIIRKISNQLDGVQFDITVYILIGEIILFINGRCNDVEILYSQNEEAGLILLDTIKKFKKKDRRQSINIVVPNHYGLGLERVPSRKPKMNFNNNYNNDLVILHESIVKILRTKNTSGLMLLHGMPGTGKSTYLRYLICNMNKEVIFLSPRLAGNMDDPQFAKMLIENPNTIIIIEDAEELLVSRDNGNSGISMLLNLTDGLLGASLNIHFICTFNTSLSTIDKALLRKGRLRILYEFKPLTIEKSKQLLRDIGKDQIEVDEPMTIADIYNVNETHFEFQKKPGVIGFASHTA